MTSPARRAQRGFGDRLRGWLTAPRLPLVLAIAAVVLTLPALSVGWQMDDHFQRLVMLEKAAGGIVPMDAFSVLDGDPAVNQEYMELGYLPWWTPDGFRLAFFRPLSLATARLDYALWPSSPALMHAHSLLWFAALVAAVTLLYRRLIEPPWVAGLAALLYTVDDAHTPPVAWLANRNAILATLFGVLCLLAHDRWRRQGWRPGPWLAAAALALGLAAGEAALGTVGYLVAYALIVEPRGSRTRSLAGYVPVLAAWAVLYRLGGYGASGSGMYIDPLGDPPAFLAALVERLPFLLMGQWTPAGAEIGGLLQPEAARWWWVVAVVIVAVGVLALLPLLRHDRVARFWGLGMVLSLLPVVATMPSNRLLFFSGLGGMGLLAAFLASVLSRQTQPARLPRRGLAWLLVVTHLVLAPLLMPVGPITLRTLGEPMQTAAASLGTDRGLAEQDVVVINAPDHLLFVTHLPTYQALAGRPLPRRIRALSVGPTAVGLTRVDEHTVRLDLARGLFSGPLGKLFSDPRQPPREGHAVELDGFEATVLSVDADGSPTAVRYRFDQPLDSASLRWLVWRDGRYAVVEPPALGAPVALPAAIGPFDELGWSD